MNAIMSHLEWVMSYMEGIESFMNGPSGWWGRFVAHSAGGSFMVRSSSLHGVIAGAFLLAGLAVGCAAAPAPASKAPADARPAAAGNAPPPASVAGTETDLAPFGAPFVGYVGMLPKGEGVKLDPTGTAADDPPGGHINLPDGNFISIHDPWEGEAFEVVSKRKDVRNLTQPSPTELRYEHTDRDQNKWEVLVLIAFGGGKKFLCGTGIGGADSAALADQIYAVCKSIHKK